MNTWLSVFTANNGGGGRGRGGGAGGEGDLKWKGVRNERCHLFLERCPEALCGETARHGTARHGTAGKVWR
ncbi:hypothetical protein E2C01_019227 [Portunus trituberculatus]|uniref:Uncharacterized protein n=1 Tax=Portunus trituberculatus TaxID=210409 RepID=A0A5B7DYL9_PORTR|nr:hypothetical protein [Portunus trituberculatus]